MSWNYRIVKTREGPAGQEQDIYTIREVYYDEDGEIKGWTENPCHPFGETWMECADDHAIMGRAIGMPIVDVTGDKPVEVSPLRKGRHDPQRRE